MKLEFEFTYRVTLKAPIEIGAGFFGKRMSWEIASGQVKGSRLNGVLVGGSDWMIDTTDPFWRPHVRTQIKTTDEAYVGMYYDGLGRPLLQNSSNLNRPTRITNGSIRSSSLAKGESSSLGLLNTWFTALLEASG